MDEIKHQTECGIFKEEKSREAHSLANSGINPQKVKHRNSIIRKV